MPADDERREFAPVERSDYLIPLGASVYAQRAHYIDLLKIPLKYRSF
ncbi:MAG TPA: hypothetical protein VF043_18085 [Ktedonobacteraceae bacterium]